MQTTATTLELSGSKAAKNVISIMTVLKEMDAAGPKETQAYLRAIKILKQEGETYP